MLMYRFPGEEVVRKNGQFREVSSITELKEGFIVKPFGDHSVFLFEENEQEREHQHYEWLKSEAIRETTKDEYEQAVSKALTALHAGKLKKVVLSRVKLIDLTTENISDLFNRLDQAYPKAFVYLLSSPLLGTWVGATPEILVKQNRQMFQIASLAGTKKIEDKSDWRMKEIHEQYLVTEYIQAALNELEVNNLKIDGPTELIAGPVKHLLTEFKGEMREGLDRLIERLHPTPAVAGLPKEDAVKFIKRVEQHNRKLYAGIIGYYSQQKSDLYVNIRCAQVVKNQAFLYLGGGLTKDSNVEEEWLETENKAKTLEKIFHFSSFAQ